MSRSPQSTSKSPLLWDHVRFVRRGDLQSLPVVLPCVRGGCGSSAQLQLFEAAHNFQTVVLLHPRAPHGYMQRTMRGRSCVLLGNVLCGRPCAARYTSRSYDNRLLSCAAFQAAVDVCE